MKMLLVFLLMVHTVNAQVQHRAGLGVYAMHGKATHEWQDFEPRWSTSPYATYELAVGRFIVAAGVAYWRDTREFSTFDENAISIARSIAVPIAFGFAIVNSRKVVSGLEALAVPKWRYWDKVKGGGLDQSTQWNVGGERVAFAYGGGAFVGYNAGPLQPKLRVGYAYSIPFNETFFESVRQDQAYVAVTLLYRFNKGSANNRDDTQPSN